MRTFDSNFQAEIESTDGPMLRVLVDVGSPVSQRLAAEVVGVTILPSVTFLQYAGELLDVGGLYDRLDGVGDARLSIADTSANRDAIVLGDLIEIYLLAIAGGSGPSSWFGYRELFFKGMISDPVVIGDGRIQFDAVSNDGSRHSARRGTLMSVGAYPEMDRDFVGRMIPVVIGSVNRSECIPYDIGPQSTLTAGISSSATSLIVGDASEFGSSGAVFIEQEAINYSGKSGNTLTGLTRGVAGTTAAAHAVGQIVALNVTPRRFFAADHRIRDISTIRADDTIVRSSYDSSNLSSGISGSDTSLTVDDASGWLTSGHVRIGSEQIGYTGRTTNTLTGLERGANNTTAATHSTGAAVTAFNWRILTENIGQGNRATLELGIHSDDPALLAIVFADRIDVDLFGAVDNGSGSVTGTAGADIDTPGYAIEWLLREYAGVSTAELLSMAVLSGLTIALRLDERFSPVAVAREIARQFRAVTIYSGGGYKVASRKLTVAESDVTSPAFTVGDSILARNDGGESTLRYSYVGLPELVNQLDYFAGVRGDGVITIDGQIEDTTSQGSYGVRSGELRLDWHGDATDASDAATWYANRLASTNTRRLVSCRTTLAGLRLEPGDWVRVTGTKVGVDTLAEVVSAGPKAISREAGASVELLLEEFHGVDPGWF